ncbi:hypothetical protein HU200_049574 [Digitaria exilis]|uniref:Uncharacterized protein n=1 Tax=Digitaria exilis TaxID=1010633 RepID=A0A835AUR2_9POAL|nr:hypothetical protein HU200_049574 [Digitaria exilis]
MADAMRTLQMTIDAFRRGNYSSEDDGRNESEVMGYIHGYYKEAVDLDLLVHGVGFCFGFFDPVSNIIANTAAAYGGSSSSPVPVEKEADREGQQGGHGKKRRRSQAGTRSKAKGKKMSSCESGEATRQRGKVACCAGASSIAARSLDGLVTFLTTYFRYLHTSEALRYLRLARADLLVAVRLIEEDRDSEAFTVHHPTTRVALTCAALSAMGDQVTGSDDPKVSPLLAIQCRLCSATLNQLFELSLEGTHGTADSDDAAVMLNAISRFPSSIKKTSYPFDLELVLTKVLQDRIHGFYLKAISCIPAPCLRSRHHRGLLKAGHCYGPFDPVTNIILNTIWYDTVFPPHQEFEVDMINYETLARTECRSLNGLITFVTELFPELSTYDATRYLLLHNGTLDSVISRANLDGYQTSAGSHDAYEAAAYAANHPNPRALATFASGCMQEGLKLKSMLEVKHTLSPDDVGIISTCLLQYPRIKPRGLVQKLTKRTSQIVSAKRKDFEAHQSSIYRCVQAALRKHKQDKGEDYELLAIYGVNAEIPLNGNFGYYTNYNGYPYSHINIWARLKGSQLADVVPTLLFIQCRNDSEDMKDSQPMCLPVSESSKYSGRCFHCELSGTKVVHPFSHAYLGQSFEFEEMARGEHSMTNNELVGDGGLRTVFLDTSEDDCIYFDPAWDADLSARLNDDAKRELEGEDEASSRAKRRMVKEVARTMAAFIDSKETQMDASMG